ncbi:AraC family transcriptional regulator [Micromonospora sp. NBC_00858]|uniref:AraC family transcriptional regulator n=1 Tax=Micromonospora sp. NBC_00858 TaxID=2975979 RepID=UPI003868D3A3|nr:AraC family transcriptional regulator [Micromonospora sp. NBC_00858]
MLDPPYALRIEDRAPLTVVALVRGAAWLVPDDAPAAPLRPGDVAVLRGPDGHLVADDPASPPQVVIHPGQRCTTLRGEPLAESMALGVRTWGTGLHGSTVLLTGTYNLPGEVSRRLLTALPPLLVVPAEEWRSPLVPLLAQEVTRDAPGQAAVLDRLLDLLLIGALRTWFGRPDAAPGWYRAAGDPVVGPALRLVENDPARPWTVAALAAEVGVSRAVLARRFTELVGEPPMAYLTGWRLALAADLLREPDATLGAVARRVGYASPYALSTASAGFAASPRASTGSAPRPTDPFSRWCWRRRTRVRRGTGSAPRRCRV